MFEAIASLIERNGDALASEWLAELERRRNVLAAGRNRGELWRDAKTWITLLLRGMRAGDLEPLQRATRLLARRLAVGGFPAADAVEAVLTFKSLLWQALIRTPELSAAPMANEVRQLALWFDSALVSMLKNYEGLTQEETGRSISADRAKQLSRMAEQETAVSQLAQEMAAQRDARRVLRLLCRGAAHLSGAQKAAAVLREGRSVRYRAAYNLPLEQLNAYAQRGRRPLTTTLEACEPRIIRDLAEGADDLCCAALRRLGLHSALSTPLRVGSRTLGLLEVFNPLAGPTWGEHDLDLVQDLAARGALALENARLLAEKEQRTSELAELNEAGRALSSHFRSPRLPAVAVASTARVLRSPSALLWLRAPGTRRFVLRASHGAVRCSGDLGFDLGKGALGQAAKGGAVAIPPAAGADLPWGDGWALAAPMRMGGRTLGLLAVQRPEEPYGDNDLRLLEALAEKVVVALHNAQCYQESKRLGERLNRAIAALGHTLGAALDLQELLQVTAHWGAELAEAAAGIVFLDEEATDPVPRAAAVRETLGQPAADPAAYRWIAAAAQERGEVVSLSARSREGDQRIRRAMRREQVRAVCAFPLSIRGRPSGALCILCRGRALRRQERDLLTSFTRQAAVGIENLTLFRETQQRLAELSDLSRASAGVSSTFDENAIVEIIVDGVARALRVPVTATALLDANGNLYLPRRGWRGLPPEFVRQFAPLPDSVAFSVIRDQRIKVMNNIAAEGRADDSLIRGLGLGSLICAPLKGREGVLGILFAADLAPRTFRPHEEALLSAYANEAALALQNALHYRAVAGHVRELEGLLDATKTLSATLELQPVLDHLANAAASLLGVPVCSIMLLDERGDHLRTVAACGLPRDHDLHADLHPGESIPGAVVAQNTVMTSTDLPRDGRFKQREAAGAEGLLSLLSVPLSVKGKPLGAINAFNRTGQPFTSAQARLLATMAAEASVAIENARLYAGAREQAASMRLLMEEVNHRIKNNLQSIIGIIQLHLTQVGEPHVQQVLREIIGRVQAIAVVHELLADEDVRAVDVKETSRRILDNALRSNPNLHAKVSGRVTGVRVRLPSRKATPLASIVNELVYNAMAHAFAGRERGHVAITLQEASGGKILVQVRDDGIGLPQGFDLERDAKLGLRIVTGLVRQDLGGEFTIAGDGGTIARVTFAK